MQWELWAKGRAAVRKVGKKCERKRESSSGGVTADRQVDRD